MTTKVLVTVPGAEPKAVDVVEISLDDKGEPVDAHLITSVLPGDSKEFYVHAHKSFTLQEHVDVQEEQAAAA